MFLLAAVLTGLGIIAVGATLVVVWLRGVLDRLRAQTEAASERSAELQRRLRASDDAVRAGEARLHEMSDRFAEALSGTHDLDTLLGAVAEAARVAARADATVVFLGDARSLTERICTVPEPADGPWVVAALDQLISLAARASRLEAPCTADLSPRAGSVLAAPLQSGGQVVGVLVVARRAGSVAISGTDAEMISRLARRCGEAVDAVRDHQATQRMSVTDPLTGAANLRHLTSSLNREVERASRFGRTLSVLMLDLDHFKKVNDVAGHDFGDRVLAEFSARLHGCLREVDLVARRGGEEFTVVLPETGADGAAAVAQRILERVRNQPFTDPGVGRGATRISRRVTVSIGVATYPDHARSAAEVMIAADRALYEAKRQGRDRFCTAEIPDTATDPVIRTAERGGAEVIRLGVAAQA